MHITRWNYPVQMLVYPDTRVAAAAIRRVKAVVNAIVTADPNAVAHLHDVDGTRQIHPPVEAAS